jgi:NAD(P)-dependent dehydrogenase (short-subunit alcohol dehydrogenase family)
MTVRLDGRAAIVTGAGNGLGRAHALLLAKLGAKVVVNDPGSAVDGRGASKVADNVVEEIRALGGEAVANYAGVDDPAGAQSIIDTCLEAFGKVDVLVNNAGILRDRSFIKMELADFEAVVRVHLMGTVNCTKAAWPHMIERKYGRIVLTTSGSGIMGSYGQSNYGAAKTAMLGLMNCLQFEGAKSNVLVNCICPIAATRMTENLLPKEMEKYLAPDQVSPAVAWMCSDACTTSGNVITGGAGYFANIRFFKTEGVQFDPREPVTVDMFANAWPQIDDLNTAKLNKGFAADATRKLAEVGAL